MEKYAMVAKPDPKNLQISYDQTILNLRDCKVKVKIG